jgi:hypothetical protein
MDDDLFDNSAPVKPAPKKPAAADDLFDGAGDEPMPAKPAPPAKKPAPKKPADDDLFDNSTDATPATPATSPAKFSNARPASASIARDVDEPSDEAANSPKPQVEDLSADDLFGDVAPEPAKRAKPAPAPVQDLDDLFDEPAPASTKQTQNSSAPKPPKSATLIQKVSTAGARIDSPSIQVRAEGEVDLSQSMRVWIDDTGKFQTCAKFVAVQDGKARLQKENGRYLTVSLDRLSAEDLQFLAQQARLAR